MPMLDLKGINTAGWSRKVAFLEAECPLIGVSLVRVMRTMIIYPSTSFFWDPW